MTCVGDDLLDRFAAGHTSGRERADVEAHLDVCETCRVLASELARLSTSRSSAAQPAAGHFLSPVTPLGSPADDAAADGAPLPRGAQVGRYVIVGVVGHGAMGIVHVAYDPDLDRTVAVKLLKSRFPAALDAGGRARLFREARALARLAHPNVVAVYDVGAIDERVFVAMELAAGGSLAAWLQAETRPVLDVVAAFVAAGRGLAAAHAAGVVHRDFKPDNVLRRADGSFVVTDFGLARVVDQHDAASPDDAPQDGTHAHGAVALTHSGALVGTPRYMAPEQHRGETPDARSDQYAFCVALAEALLGRPPFSARTVVGLRDEKERGAPPLPFRRQVPRAVRRSIERGLQPDAGDRHPSMAVLLSALDAAMGARRRRIVVASAIAAAALATASVALAPAAVAPCQGTERQLVAVWDDDVRQQTRAALLATGHPQAERAADRAVMLLDTYAQRFVAEHQATCAATRIDGQQSEQVLDVRTACLERKKTQLGILAARLAQADGALVEQAATAAAGLPNLLACRDVSSLMKTTPPPPELRARVEAVERTIAQAHTALTLGKLDEVGAALPPALAEARALGHAPTLAEVLHLAGLHALRAGRIDDNIRLLDEAVVAAEAGGHDRLAALAKANLIAPFVHEQRFAEGHRARAYAQAAIARLGGDPSIEARLDGDTALLYLMEGEPDAALAYAQRAVELCTLATSADSHEAAHANTILGAVLSDLGRYGPAEEHFKNALATNAAWFGDDHVRVGVLLQKLGELALYLGHPDDAVVKFARAVEIQEASFGPEHLRVSATLGSLASALLAQGDHDAAEQVAARALRNATAALGPRHGIVASAQHGLGEVALVLGRDGEARKRFDEALAITKALVGTEHHDVARELEALGRVEARAGRHTQALALFQRAAAILEAKLGAAHVELAAPLAGIGRAQLALGDARAAQATLATVVERLDAVGSVSRRRMDAAADLARAERLAALR